MLPTCTQSAQAAGRTKHQGKVADQNLLNCRGTGAACFSAWWQSLVIDNILPSRLNPFFSCVPHGKALRFRKSSFLLWVSRGLIPGGRGPGLRPPVLPAMDEEDVKEDLI